MQRLKILAVVLLALLGTVMGRMPAAQPHVTPSRTNYAAALDGGLMHWKSFPITVRIVHDRHYTANLERLTRQGLDEWATATHGLVSYTIVSTGGDVVVSFHPAMDYCDTEPLPYPHSRAIRNVTMRIGTRDPYGGPSLSDSIVQAMIAHEWGHALGLCGHSPNPRDLMYWGIDNNRAITARDLRTLEMAYGDAFTRGLEQTTRQRP